jgi:hypothetical protein
MSSVTKEWLIVIAFFLFAWGLTFAETLWLNKKNWTSFGKAFAFAAATNVIGFFVGFFVIFVVFGVILAMAWDGSLENMPLGDAGIIAAMVFGVLFFPIFLALCKRLFLKILKIQTGKAAWAFSFASSFLIVFLSLGVPILGYLILK